MFDIDPSATNPSSSALQLQSVIELIKLRLQPSPSDDLRKQRIATLLASIKRNANSAPQSYLVERLGLDGHEVDVVWLLAAIAADPEVRRLMAEEFTPTGDPTLDGLRRIAYGTNLSHRALRELGEAGRLRSLGIIERSDGRGPTLHEHQQTWALSRRVLSLLHGDLSFDPLLVASLPENVRALDELAVGANAIADVHDAVRRPNAIVVVSGMPGLGRRTLLVSAAQDAGMKPLQVDAGRLPKDLPSLRTELRHVARECLLFSCAPLIIGIDVLTPDAIDAIGSELTAHVPGVVLATSGIHRPTIKWGRPLIAIELTHPHSAQLGDLWLAALGQGTSADATHLANQFPLAPAFIQRAAEAALARAGGKPIRSEDILAGVRVVVDDKLGQLAKRVRVTQSWLDLVMPQDQVNSVVELMARVRERSRVYEQWGFAAKVGKGLGVTALFSGPPGTGKSMCAALIAKDLALELYQVDLAKIASKWIGETEKNLAALFDAAEACHAVLLFDEADALFGKRTAQTSSNDRHANSETNYLLQRLESYTGICILTSNHENNIDPAFQRRLSLHLRFELPDADERTMLWRAMFPTSAPVESGIDFDALARRYEMSGGYIRNAALRAAFIAADSDGPITQAHLERAARVEYEGMGKIAPSAITFEMS